MMMMNTKVGCLWPLLEISGELQGEIRGTVPSCPEGYSTFLHLQKTIQLR